MNRIIILLSAVALFSLAACNQEKDTRYFAPEISFENGSYPVKSEDGGLDVAVTLSRPATQELTINLNIESSLQEELQFKLSSHSLSIAEGASSASLHITLVDDEIWDTESWIDLILAPGTRYTLNPDSNCTARVSISKDVQLPAIKLIVPSGVEINPYLPETFNCVLETSRAQARNMAVQLDFGDLVCGKDYLINGEATTVVTFPAGTEWIPFKVQILYQDVSGIDKHAVLSVVQQKGQYVPAAGVSEADIHLYDPMVDFKPLLRTSALQNGAGFQIRQAFKGPDGAWEGNTNVDLGQSSEGSNYLRCYRNMFDHPSFGCRANASVSQPLRISDLFPVYEYNVSKNPVAILDYGNDQGHRQFTPVDSLMRFVLDKGETQKGGIYLTKPRTFEARIGTYAEWQADEAGGKAWVVDSKATKGDIAASTHHAITGRISVTLHKLEGRFDFSNSSEPVLLTAWFSSDSDQFLQEIDNTKIAATQEDGLWKIEYKLWPR
ncbi:MAG: hypothetical protein IKZ51_02765 [Bacteroidales bacterium]|nr:hypothetical protein [Bacteroidales bacterium]